MVETVPVPELRGTRGDTGELHHNRRRALAIAATPAVVVLIVAALVGLAAGAALIGVIVGVAVGLVLWSAVWRRATAVLLRSLGVREGDDAELARADNLVDGLCASMGVELPDIAVIDNDARQALAVGRTPATATLVVTTGLLESLDPVALEAVLAHELVHIKRGDIAPATMAAAVLLPVSAVLPVAGVVHNLAGRGRELRTDTLAVAVTRYPPGLREALVAMTDGPAPRAGSPLVRSPVARTTRWLWTVPLPETPGGSITRPPMRSGSSMRPLPGWPRSTKPDPGRPAEPAETGANRRRHPRRNAA